MRARLDALGSGHYRRGPGERRAEVQRSTLRLGPVPKTTIGSFPQTPRIRSDRAAFRAGRLDTTEYQGRMRGEIERVIRLQEEIGLDVLVHGEPERNDMVQYFAEHLDGFATTANGWVQSYGSRCVRPPVLRGEVSRPEPITVSWSSSAQSFVEAARSKTEMLAELGAGVTRGLGPGVYDVYSPEVPSAGDIGGLLAVAKRYVPGDRLWANPDCGLKTRGEDEVVAALRNLVSGAHVVR